MERDYQHVYRILFNLQGVLSDKLPNFDDITALVKKWFLGRDGKWLLVFDEMDALFEEGNCKANYFHTWLPATNNVHVVITTRDSRAADLTTLEAIEVDCMDKEEASALFKTCAGLVTNQQDHYVYQIVEELGFFALAVSLAGYYVKQTPWLSSDLARYLPQYRQQRKDILSEKPRQAVHYYKESVLTTWETSFSAVQVRSASAGNIFLLLCWLNPNDVFEEVFDSVLIPPDEMMPREAKTLEQFRSILWLTTEGIDMHSVSSCFRYLQDYSLVRWERTQGSYRIHTLVQAWAQDRLDSESQEAFITLAVELLTSALYLQPSGYRLRERLVSHLNRLCHTISERISKRVDRQDNVNVDLLACLDKVDDAFYGIGYHTLSMSVRRIKADILPSVYGELNPRSLRAKSSLSYSLYLCGYLRPARELVEEILELQSQVLGEDHEDSIVSLAGLALLSSYREGWETAIKLQTLALERLQSRGVEFSNESLKVQARLARFLSLSGDLDGGQALSEEILRTPSQLHDVDEGPLLDAMLSMSSDFYLAGFFEKAYSLSMEVVARGQALLGNFPFKKFDGLYNAASSLRAMGRIAEAEKMLLELCEKSQHAHGVTHPVTLKYLCGLADCFGSRGDHVRALTLQTEITVFSYQNRDEVSYKYPYMRGRLTDALQRCGDYYYAVKALEEAYCRSCSVGVTAYKVVLNILSSQINRLVARGDCSSAIALAREFLDDVQREFGRGHSRTLCASQRLAILLVGNSQWAEAQKIHERTLETLAESLSDCDPNLITTRGNLVYVLGKRRKLEEAELLMREVVRNCIAHAPVHWASASMHTLALILIARDTVEEGWSLHLKAAAMARPDSGLYHSETWLRFSPVVCGLVVNDWCEAAEEYADKINAKCEQALGPHDPRTLSLRRWLASRESSSASSEISSALFDRPRCIVTYSSTGRPMRISKWRLRPFIRRKVIVRLPRSKRGQWEEISIRSWESAVIGP